MLEGNILSQEEAELFAKEYKLQRKIRISEPVDDEAITLNQAFGLAVDLADLAVTRKQPTNEQLQAVGQFSNLEAYGLLVGLQSAVNAGVLPSREQIKSIEQLRITTLGKVDSNDLICFIDLLDPELKGLPLINQMILLQSNQEKFESVKSNYEKEANAERLKKFYESNPNSWIAQFLKNQGHS